jgi:transposase-like protein
VVITHPSSFTEIPAMDAILKSQAEKLANELATQVTTLEDLNGLMRTMMKTALERMLNTEMDVHLQRRGPTDDANTTATPTPEPTPKTTAKNRRNGHSKKTVGSDRGEFTLQTPRDRNGTFEPQLIKKGQRRLEGFDEKILALYAKGMTTRDIQEVVQELYGVEVSATLVSEITADLDAEVSAWRTRRLDAVWPIVYLDGIVVHVRGENGRVSQHTMYVAIGVNLQGRKELLGLWLAETEGAKFWLACLTDRKERGVEDIFIVCVDGLSGFPEAIRAAFPQTKVQLCIVHLVRAALKYVTDTDSREVASDLKTIYQSATVLEAEESLAKFATKWESKYPTIVKQWRAKWKEIIPLFEFPQAIRKAIYTTNAIESVNSVIRKFTRNRKQYPNGDSALKLVYLAIHEASKKWTMPIKGWKAALNHFAIVFEGRLPLQTT